MSDKINAENWMGNIKIVHWWSIKILFSQKFFLYELTNNNENINLTDNAKLILLDFGNLFSNITPKDTFSLIDDLLGTVKSTYVFTQISVLY